MAAVRLSYAPKGDDVRRGDQVLVALRCRAGRELLDDHAANGGACVRSRL